MAAVTSLILVKRFTYRDDASEEFSNRYSFNGPPPGDAPSWSVLADDLWNIEKHVFHNGIERVAAYGYDSDDPKAHSVWNFEYDPGLPANKGDFAGISGFKMAGDQAGLVAWQLGKKNARGKWIYLRKYFHGGFINSSDSDELETAYIAALDVLHGPAGVTTFHGGLRAQRYDAPITASATKRYVTTRSLKRRGRRPRAGA